MATEYEQRHEDWLSSLSPREGSCLNLSSVEPCVNKAVSHLNVLKQRLTQQKRTSKEHAQKPQPRASFSDIHTCEERASKVHRDAERMSSQGSTPKPCLRLMSGASVRVSDRELCVEGTTTGTVVERSVGRREGERDLLGGWPGWDDVILGAVCLVVRLEEDRQEALESLGGERERVRGLREALDAEAERRLNLLASVVQEEHERFFRDVLELKWHVSYEGRQLGRVKDNLRITAERNAELKTEVAYLTETCPLIEEKLVLENDNMSKISQQQQQVADLLSQAKHRLMQTEDKSQQAHSRANAEKLQLEQTLGEIRKKVRVACDQLTGVSGELTALTQKVNDAHKTIADHEKQGSHYEEKSEQCQIQQSAIKSRVSCQRDDHARLEVTYQKIEERNCKLRENMETERGDLESQEALLQSTLQGEERALREARDGNEETEQEIDSLKERIAACHEQTEDDSKSVERVKRELVRLDQQLGVSMAQYSKVREENFKLNGQLKDEENKTGDIEYSLKSTIDTLQQQLKEETKTKFTFEGMVNADSFELDKLQVENRKRVEKAEKMVSETERQSKGETNRVSDLEEHMRAQQVTQETLTSQLAAVKADHSRREKELGEKRGVLQPEETQLRGDVQEKVSAVEETSERIRLLERRVEDVVRSTAMVEKMGRDTSATNEKLESQVSDLQEQVAEERREEESWREEFKDISEFSSDAQEKHMNYVEERKTLLEQNKVGLQEALSTNAALAERYQRLQTGFVEVKTLALRMLERKLDLETSLRDHKQLLAFQARMYSVVQASYEHRGASSRRDLAEFHHMSHHNIQQLRALQARFDAAIRAMHEFLEHGLHCDAAAAVDGRGTQEHETVHGTSTKRKDKSVSFNVPVTVA